MKQQDTYKTILVISAGLLVFYFFSENKYWLYAAIILSITSILIPAIAEKVMQLWFKLATVLGWINARILLTVIFFLVLFPVALLRKLFTSKKNKPADSQSLYVVRNHVFTAMDMENPW